MATSSDILLRWVLGLLSAIFITIGLNVIHSTDENTLAMVALSGEVKSLKENTYTNTAAAKEHGVLTNRIVGLEGKVGNIGDRQTRYETRLTRLERKTDTGP